MILAVFVTGNFLGHLNNVIFCYKFTCRFKDWYIQIVFPFDTGNQTDLLHARKALLLKLFLKPI